MSRLTPSFALAALTAFASTAVPAAALPHPRPGLEIGLVGSKPSIPEAPSLDAAGRTSALGVSGGATLEFGGPRGPAIVTGLRYVGDPDRVDADVVVDLGGGNAYRVSGRTTVWFDRLGLPIRVRSGLPMGHGLSVEAGLEPQYLLRARRTDHLSFRDQSAAAPARARRPAGPGAIIFESVGTLEGDATSLYPRWNLAASGGLGWGFGLFGRSAALRARWQQGLVDQAKAVDVRQYTRSGELALGIGW